MRFNDIWDEQNLNAIDDALRHIDITGVTCDSRRVEPGYLFAALPGSQADGRAFINDAVAKGAAVILVPADSEDIANINVPVIRDIDPRRRYARAAANFYDAQPANIGAVTGTNGKTSVAWFARQLLNASGVAAASAGTLGIKASSADGADIINIRGSLTTPDPADLHRDLKGVVELGVEYLVIEASSHGLDQRRLDGLNIRVGAFTNLSRDHLDYHKTEDAYLAAKLRLFDVLVENAGVAVINIDGAFADVFASAAERRGLKVVRTGSDESCDPRLLSVEAVPDGLAVELVVQGTAHKLHLPLIGAFQAENAVVALALAGALGADLHSAIPALKTLHAAPGRIQFCGLRDNGAAVFVDYAHTPDALKTVLAAARPHAKGRVHVVFGCGGDRDPGKRPEMGKAAAAGADVVILTDDNPRTEDAAEIRRQAKVGAPDAMVIADRRDAIHAAIGGLAKGDVLVVAGKGHEQGQIVGTEVRPFDDAAEVRAALSEVNA